MLNKTINKNDERDSRSCISITSKSVNVARASFTKSSAGATVAFKVFTIACWQATLAATLPVRRASGRCKGQVRHIVVVQARGGSGRGTRVGAVTGA